MNGIRGNGLDRQRPAPVTVWPRPGSPRTIHHAGTWDLRAGATPTDVRPYFVKVPSVIVWFPLASIASTSN